MSRRLREGWYAGKWQGRHVRRCALVPPLTVGQQVLFEASRPWPDSNVAWMTLNSRSNVIFLPRCRYISKAEALKMLDRMTE